MKPNKKILDLIESGFSFKTLNKLSEKQLTQLHSRVIKESVTTQTLPPQKVTKITPDTLKGAGANVGNVDITMDGSGNVIAKGPVNSSVDKSKNKIIKSAGEMDESKTKKTKSKNPLAICTSSLSDEFGTSERSEWTKSQMKKYERCVMGVKEKMNEGKNPFEFILENKITQLIEKHVHPKMTKKDFLEVLTKKMIQETKTKEKEKEKTKPTTKPGTPFSPKPGPNPAPKAKKGNIPDWFTFDKLGLKIR